MKYKSSVHIFGWRLGLGLGLIGNVCKQTSLQTIPHADTHEVPWSLVETWTWTSVPGLSQTVSFEGRFLKLNLIVSVFTGRL